MQNAHNIHSCKSFEEYSIGQTTYWKIKSFSINFKISLEYVISMTSVHKEFTLEINNKLGWCCSMAECPPRN